MRCIAVVLWGFRLFAQSGDSDAAAEFNQGHYAAAERLFRQELAALEKAVGPDGRALTQPLNNLATVYCRELRYAQAIPLYERSLRILAATVGAENAESAAVWNNLGEVHAALGNYQTAE